MNILAGKLKVAATFKPDGDNRMKGFAKYASTPDTKVVVSITLAVAKDTHTDHKH